MSGACMAEEAEGKSKPTMVRAAFAIEAPGSHQPQ